MPAWHQAAEVCVSHPGVALLRLCVFHRRSTSALLDAADELIAAEAHLPHIGVSTFHGR